MLIVRYFLFAILTLVSIGGRATAEDFYLADGNLFPGQLLLSGAGGVERLIHRREAVANRAYPKAAMKLAQVAVGPGGKIYFASGLDGYVMHLLDGRNEIASFEFDGQIRDLACADNDHTVYFSVVPTPQNGEPLADGKIYRRDLWAGQPSEVATIRQAEVGGNWWGTFAIRDGVYYLTTFENPSRIYKLASTTPELVAELPFKINGLAASADGNFYFTDGSDKVYRTADFHSVETALRGEHQFTDAASPAVASPAIP
jgi:outer membrane protein assembly factor BamB